MKKSAIFIGIDPGSRTLGYAVLFCFSSISLLKSGCLRFSKSDSLERRLRFSFDFFSSLLSDLRGRYPDSSFFFSLERPFFYKNASSAFTIHCFYSVGLLLSTYAATEPFSFSPSEVKRLVCGTGSASKEEVAQSLRTFFPCLSSCISNFDETDAIAISLASFFCYEKRAPSSS
jgi:crossover junction endodeoxyribonuclease RuvC